MSAHAVMLSLWEVIALFVAAVFILGLIFWGMFRFLLWVSGYQGD